MSADDEVFDDRHRRLHGAVTSIADGVTAFVARPGATVRVVAKQSAADWRRYTQRVGQAFTETNQLTETLRRALPGIDAGQGPRSQRAAVDALAHPKAEYAVVVEAGDEGPLTVVTFQRNKGDLVVLGGGTTFPSVPAGVLADASLPSGEQAGSVAQYALASIGGQETLTLSHEVSPDTWHGPRALEARRMIGTSGQAFSTKAAAPTWSADDLRHITEQVTLRQTDGRHPFPQVVSPVAAGSHGPRRWATELKGWVDRGGTIEVYDHVDQEQRDAAGLAMLGLAANSDYLAQNPIPDKPGVRTMVASVDGRPQALVTAGYDAAGDLHVLRFIASPDRGAFRAAEVTMMEAARQAGGGVSFSTAAAQEYAKTAEYAISAADAAHRSSLLQVTLRGLDRESGTRMAELLDGLEPEPGQPVVGAAALAASVQRFREAGGDVLFLSPSDPTFIALQEKASETVWAAAETADGAVPGGVDALWRTLNPPALDAADTGDQRVAVAVLDGAPVAAAGVKVTTARFELGEFGALPGGDDALVAAVVEGAHRRAFRTKPVAMFLPSDRAKPEEFAVVGLRVTGVRALDDESRVEVRLPEAWRQGVLTADEGSGWMSARRFDQVAAELTRFQDSGGVVFRLDHAVDAERLLAEETVREVMSDYPGKAPELPVPPVNGNRVTVMARSDEYGPAYITFDGTPAGDLEVVDVAAKGYDLTAREAVRYWFCDRLAEHGREPVLNERITDNEQARGTWQPDQSRHLVLAMRNRLGDRPAELVRSVPKSASAEPRGPGRDDQGQAPRHRGGGPGNRRSGPVER